MCLIVVVEGQTEEAFVKEVLGPHLDCRGVYASATIVGKMIAQKRGHRGRGGGHFRHWQKDIARIVGGDRSDDLRVTTLFDLYGLPEDFPGLDAHGSEADTSRRCDALEAALGAEVDDRRFIPYIQRHEFEALVLASLPSLRELLDAEDDLAGLTTLEAVVDATAPEDINDGTTTAPSKRLLAHVPGVPRRRVGSAHLPRTGGEPIEAQRSRPPDGLRASPCPDVAVPRRVAAGMNPDRRSCWDGSSATRVRARPGRGRLKRGRGRVPAYASTGGSVGSPVFGSTSGMARRRR